MRRYRATVQVPLGIAVPLYCVRPWLAGGGQDYRPAIFAMLITFYRSMPVALCTCRRACWVDRLHAWHAASGSLPAFHDRRTTWAVFVADFGTLCLILPSRFVDEPIRDGHLLVYASKMCVGQRESVLNFPFCFCFATGTSQNPASLYQTLFESANKNVFW